jgi:multicomponent Na+:H+ antiporter subunit F
MFAFAACAILVAIALALVHAFRGPTLYDRILALNMVGTQIVLMVAVLGFLTGRPEFLDIALVYALISFVSTLAVLKFCCRRHDPSDCRCSVGDKK